MAKKEKFTFRTPLHLACGNDEFRPVFSYVHFINGMAYATDGHILIEQSIEYYCDVINKEKLNGHAIHRDAYKFIQKCQFVEANDAGLTCDTKDGARFFYPFPDMSAFKVPNFAPMFKVNLQSTSSIGITPSYMQILNKALYKLRGGSVRCELQGDNGAILVTVPEMMDQRAVWMPVMIHE